MARKKIYYTIAETFTALLLQKKVKQAHFYDQEACTILVKYLPIRKLEDVLNGEVLTIGWVKEAAKIELMHRRLLGKRQCRM